MVVQRRAAAVSLAQECFPTPLEPQNRGRCPTRWRGRRRCPRLDRALRSRVSSTSRGLSHSYHGQENSQEPLIQGAKRVPPAARAPELRPSLTAAPLAALVLLSWVRVPRWARLDQCREQPSLSSNAKTLRSS